jgi:sec-independent protein translocase protein TatC
MQIPTRALAIAGAPMMRPADEGAGTGDEPSSGFLSHLVELRARLLPCVAAVVVFAAGLMPFARQIYGWLAQPLLQQLPEGSGLVAIGVIAPVMAPIKLVLVLAVVLALPVLLYQAWAFVAPGLYTHEKRLVLPLLTASVLLFYLGAAFAYYLVFPIIFGVTAAMAPEGVAVMPDINAYLDFVLFSFLAFGAAFEIPIVVVLLDRTGVMSADVLAAQRPYVIVGAVVIGAVLTPPDVISQLLLAIPMYLLFEAGLLLTRLMRRLR